MKKQRPPEFYIEKMIEKIDTEIKREFERTPHINRFDHRPIKIGPDRRILITQGTHQQKLFDVSNNELVNIIRKKVG